MKKLIKRSYQATVKRGLITKNTASYQFINKIKEELDETIKEYEMGYKDKMFVEVADIVLTCFNFAHHNGIDLVQVMEYKTLFNENRLD